jgi:hypothetical protein
LCRAIGLDLRRGGDRNIVGNHYVQIQDDQYDAGCEDCDAHKKMGKIQMERSDDWMTTNVTAAGPELGETTEDGIANLGSRTNIAS